MPDPGLACRPVRGLTALGQQPQVRPMTRFPVSSRWDGGVSGTRMLIKQPVARAGGQVLDVLAHRREHRDRVPSCPGATHRENGDVTGNPETEFPAGGERTDGLDVRCDEQRRRAMAVDRPRPAVFAQQRRGRLMPAFLAHFGEGHQAVPTGSSGPALALAPAAEPKSLGRGVRRSDDAADVGVTVHLEVVDRGDRIGQVVGPDARERPAVRQLLEDQHRDLDRLHDRGAERHPRSNEDAVDLTIDEGAQQPVGDAAVSVGTARKSEVALLSEGLLDRLRELGEERVVPIGHQQPDRLGAATSQGARDGVRSVVEPGDGVQNPRACRRGDGPRSVVEHVADDGRRHARGPGDVGSRHRHE